MTPEQLVRAVNIQARLDALGARIGGFTVLDASAEQIIEDMLTAIEMFLDRKYKPARPLYDSPSHEGPLGEGPVAGCKCHGCYVGS